jgi:protein TonB
MKILLSLLILLSFTIKAQDLIKFVSKSGVSEVEIETKDVADSPDIFELVEEKAEYPGGLAAMGQFMRDNMHYPDSARARGISGKCFLKFVVNETGGISNVEVLQGVPGCADCDEEAIRVVNLSIYTAVVANTLLEVKVLAVSVCMQTCATL